MTVTTAVTDTAASAEGRGHFFGTKREYFRILARDTLALVVTLGIYRFWVSTNARRYLWSRTELAGEQLEYTGVPAELLLGFLGLIVVTTPLVVASNVLTWASGESALIGLMTYAPFVLLTPLAVLALYQARRYRVDHTVFRGLHFHQSGSAWIYVLLIALWSVGVMLTFGLAYPWARASLERYKMRHTHYGDLQASFVESGWTLFKRGFLFWLIVWGPVLLMNLGADPKAEKITAIAIMSWLAITVAIIYPFFRAMALRWRINGIRLGNLSLSADFPVWSFARAYLFFYVWMALLAAVVGFLVTLGLRHISAAHSVPAEAISVILIVLGYFIIVTLAAFAYQATVRLVTWRVIAGSLVLHGLDQLDRVRARPEHDGHRGRIGAAINLGGF